MGKEQVDEAGSLFRSVLPDKPQKGKKPEVAGSLVVSPELKATLVQAHVLIGVPPSVKRNETVSPAVAQAALEAAKAKKAAADAAKKVCCALFLGCTYFAPACSPCAVPFVNVACGRRPWSRLPGVGQHLR